MSGLFLWCNIVLAFRTNLEESKLTPKENNSSESFPENDTENTKEENVKAFSEFLEEASNQNNLVENTNLNSEEQKQNIGQSLFRRFLNNGFDGISTNPNYKMLALLVILLINLSLFFVIGNIGKAFLRNAGIMG